MRSSASATTAGAATRSRNWARPGHESRHNLAYWERRPYEAVGPGAHAFDGATRRWNAARLDGYVGGADPAGSGEAAAAAGRRGDRSTATAAAAEAAILGLRTGHGVLPLGRDRAAARTTWFGWALAAELLDVTGRRPDRPDDARPPALERAVLAARLTSGPRDPLGQHLAGDVLARLAQTRAPW